MEFGIIVGLSLLSAIALIVALWPWANKGGDGRSRLIIVVLACLTVLAGPIAAYEWLADPNQTAATSEAEVGDGSLSSSNAQWEWGGPQAITNSRPAQKDMSLEAVTARLQTKLKRNPDDVQGWLLLARSYTALGDHTKAEGIFADLMQKWPENAGVQIAYGDALVQRASGTVTSEARALFESAASRDPEELRSRYYLALYDSQQGDEKSAYDQWLALAESAPKDAPWLAEVTERIRESADRLGIKVQPIAAVSTPLPQSASAPNPSAQQVDAAMAMSPQDRQAYIYSMVESLSARLESNPNDLQGWLRLGRSYSVLGETDKAKSAYENGLKTFPENAELALRLEALKAQ